MNSKRLAIGLSAIAIVLSVINLLVVFIPTLHPTSGVAGEVAPVLRTRSIELVDDQGRLRAQLLVLPSTVQADGQKSADTVLFRLIDPNGRPGVKIGTSADGSGMSLAGDSEFNAWNGVQILADGTASQVKLTDKDGRIQTVQP